jgi:hypothetical protein
VSRRNDIWQRKPAGLVLGLDFSGQRVTTPAGQTGTLAGNAAVAAGTRYLALDGVGDYLTFPDETGLSFTSGGGVDLPASMVMWVWLDAAVTARRFLIIKGAEYLLEIGAATDTYKGISLACWKSDFSAGIVGHMNALTGISSGQWLHVGATYSGSKTSAGISLYLAGVSQAVTSGSFGVYAGMTNTANGLQICGSGGGNVWAGKIADLRMYNRALTQPEIAQIYHAGAARIAQGGTP